ncbi:MAG: hypothetical protein RIE08_04985 [Acidimicrobiales bacterium]
MSTALAIAPDGTLCIDKTGPDDVIAAQAEILAGLDIAGLPTLLAQPSPECLRLRHAGRHTLATWSAPSPRDRAAVVAAVADTLDALHQAGIVHGAIRPDHVVIAGNGSPVLVGLSSARRVSNPSALSPAAPPVERRDDIEALGRLCVVAPAGKGAPDAGFARFLRTRRDGVSTELNGIADKIRSGRFDSARGVADALRDAFGLDTADDPTRAAPIPRREPPPATGDVPDPDPVRSEAAAPARTGRNLPGAARAALGACCVVIAGIAVAMGVGTLMPSSGDIPADGPLDFSAQDSLDTDDDAALRQTAVDTAPEPPQTAGISPGTPPCSDAAGHDVDGDGCPDDVVIEAGAVIIDGARYPVGRPGDDLAVGDWDCDGTATLDLVRGGTGEVWMFARWPRDEPLTATLEAEVSPPLETTVVTSPADGCESLVVRGDGEVWSSADP